MSAEHNIETCETIACPLCDVERLRVDLSAMTASYDRVRLAMIEMRETHHRAILAARADERERCVVEHADKALRFAERMAEIGRVAP